jgi:hypothetical protein
MERDKRRATWMKEVIEVDQNNTEQVRRDVCDTSIEYQKHAEEITERKS